jgi:hypothetical protein
MVEKKTAFTGSNENAKNGYSGKSQTQWGASEDSANLSIEKGGMRGAGLIAVMIAEIALKKKATDLAEDYYETNKEDYDFFIEQHQGPIQQTAEEAFDDNVNPEYHPDNYFAGAIALGKTALVDKQWFEVRRRAHRYAVGAQRRIDYEFAGIRTHAMIGAWNIGRRYERNWVDDRNNRRFDRRIAVANIGIGVGNIVAQGLSSSVQRLASGYDNIGDMVSTIGNGLAANMGYRAGRADTAQRFEAGTKTTKSISKGKE